jgi:hypothetical protein
LALKLVSVQTSQLCMENGISALRSVLLLKATMTKMTQTRQIRSQAKGFAKAQRSAIEDEGLQRWLFPEWKVYIFPTGQVRWSKLSQKPGST